MKNLMNSYHKKEANWFLAFLISHIAGWIIAWVQTFWILHEVKKMTRRM